MKSKLLGFGMLMLIFTACGERHPHSDGPPPENSSAITTDMNTHPAPGEENPSDGPPQNDTNLYANLSPDLIPPIAYVEAWGKWVVNIDDAIEAFPDYEEYRSEFPHTVEMDEVTGFTTVVDPGTGGGSTEWNFTFFEKTDGWLIAAVTETTREPESTDSKIWFGRWMGTTYEEVQPMIGLSQEDFFDAGVEELLDKYPLVSLEYQLSNNRTELRVSASPNPPYQCKDGKIAVDNVPENEVAQICNSAWAKYTTQTLVYGFNPEKGTFEEKERIAVN